MVARLSRVLAVGLGLTSGARAEPARTTVALSWVRAPGAEACATLPEVTASVEARLRRVAFASAREAESLIEATIARDPKNSGFLVHIVLSDRMAAPLGTRDLEVLGDDCRAVTDTAALAIALMVEPDAASTGGAEAAYLPDGPSGAAAPAASVPSPRPESPAQPCVDSGRAPAAAPRPSHWRTRLGLGGLATVGQLPGPAPGVLGSVRLAAPRGLVGVEVLARYLAEKSVEARPGAGGSFSASSVGLGAFWVPLQRDRFAFSLDAAAEVGQLNARGYNFTVANLYSREWIVNADFGAELAFHAVGPLSVLLRLGLNVPLVQHQFDARIESELVTIFDTSPLIGEASLGLAFAP
jgi:hypothetical protein